MVRRAAAREFQILEGIRHPGILHADGYHDTERGPALVFARDPDALRLDHFILRHGARLDASLRLHLLREIAEAVHYAHGRRLVHRALCPQSILVSNPEATEPTVQVFNWQTAMRTRSTSTEVPSVVGPTRHLEDLVEDASLVYLAPESLTFETAAGEPLDVFSLGAVAYHLFSGQPPATTLLELHDKLKRGQGLQLSDVLDGAGDRLRELIQHSTHPEVSSRLSDVDEFLLFLGDVEDELTRPDEPAEVNPLEAGAEDRLKGGFTVTRRLGRGSTAVALLVTRGDREYVVKVAASTELNDRLRQEAEVLQKLRHQHIVELHEVVELGLLSPAGHKKGAAVTVAPGGDPDQVAAARAGRSRLRNRVQTTSMSGSPRSSAATMAGNSASTWGVGARMRAGLRASNRRARHLPMRYETGLPSAVIRFRT